MSPRSDNPFIRGPKGRALQHFVDAMEDLRVRCRLTATAYDATQAAGIVRRLLIDGKPLAVTAEQFTEIPSEFTWSKDMYAGDNWGFIMSGHHFDPGLSPMSLQYTATTPGPSTVTGNKEELLRAEILRHGSAARDFVSVLEFVKWLANDEGGVHVDMFKSAELRTRFRDAQAVVPEHTKWTMLAGGRVVYSGLEPTLFGVGRTLQLLLR